MTTRTVRDKFARLSQMATLLTLESVRGGWASTHMLCSQAPASAASPWSTFSACSAGGSLPVGCVLLCLTPYLPLANVPPPIISSLPAVC